MSETYRLELTAEQVAKVYALTGSVLASDPDTTHVRRLCSEILAARLHHGNGTTRYQASLAVRLDEL